MKWFLKLLLIIGVLFLTLIFVNGEGKCQMTTNEKLLTEINIDVKYIKNSIEELKDNLNQMQGEVYGLDKRIIDVEHKTIVLENVINDIEGINKWFLGILATLVTGIILHECRITRIVRVANGNNKNRA